VQNMIKQNRSLSDKTDVLQRNIFWWAEVPSSTFGTWTRYDAKAYAHNTICPRAHWHINASCVKIRGTFVQKKRDRNPKPVRQEGAKIYAQRATVRYSEDSRSEDKAMLGSNLSTESMKSKGCGCQKPLTRRESLAFGHRR